MFQPHPPPLRGDPSRPWTPGDMPQQMAHFPALTADGDSRRSSHWKAPGRHYLWRRDSRTLRALRSQLGGDVFSRGGELFSELPAQFCLYLLLHHARSGAY
ncbi:hypothetical protein AAFF_G00287620 [Aldrovandia affinis]|uniref:Uncharacterized protein n=1 Tax=Aldrovandia affinis TaxID=143900 RepID=A0AAD7SR48_9TELE|nr:hypothetical protein AAFF_G00287620 [Aldrovandia affinis]